MGFGSEQLGRYNETMTDSLKNLDSVLAHLADVVDARRADLANGKIDSSSSYIAQLFTKGDDAILKKIGEEATETVMAAKDGDPEKIVYEVADLWFHSMVLLAHQGLSSQAVLSELERRFGLSGIVEKAQRGDH